MSRKKKTVIHTLPANKSMWGLMAFRFKKNKLAMLGLFIIALLILAVLLAPVYVDYDLVYTQNMADRFLSPCAEHWFGTDQLGRDLFARVLYGGRTSLFVGITATIISVLIGIPLGIACAVKQYSLIDSCSTIFALIFISIPTFWLGLMMIILFSVQLHWLPPNGSETLAHFIMPAITCAGTTLATLIRMTRSTMLEVIRQDYITTARAKGLPESRVITAHALKNALIPVITVIGVQIGRTIGNSVVTETIFTIPGIGSLMVNAVKQSNYEVVQGCVLIIAICFSVVNLLVDILYAFLDPRIKGQYVSRRRRIAPRRAEKQGEEAA